SRLDDQLVTRVDQEHYCRFWSFYQRGCQQVQTASRVVYQVFANRFQTLVGQALRKRQCKRLKRMRAWNDGIQVNPLLASRQSTSLQMRKQTRHHNAGFA